MPQIGQPPWPESAARAQGSLVELIYPVSFEARLLEARARRAAAITRRSPVERCALGPAPYARGANVREEGWAADERGGVEDNAAPQTRPHPPEPRPF